VGRECLKSGGLVEEGGPRAGRGGVGGNGYRLGPCASVLGHSPGPTMTSTLAGFTVATASSARRRTVGDGGGGSGVPGGKTSATKASGAPPPLRKVARDVTGLSPGEFHRHLMRAVDLLGGVSANVPVLFTYQLEGVFSLVQGLVSRDTPGMLLGDVMGLGKTLQGMLTAFYVMHTLGMTEARGRPHPALFIVPRSAMAAWQAQTERLFPNCFSDGRAYACKSQAADARIPEEAFLVFATPGKVKSKAQRHKFQRTWCVIVVDEAHELLHITTQAFTAVHELVQASKPKVLLLTGTPVSPSQPARSLAAIFSLVGSPDPMLRTMAFWQDVMGPDDDEGGSAGIAVVKRELEKVMVRRTHATATGGFCLSPCDVVHVDVRVGDAEGVAYRVVGDRLARLLPPLLQLLHKKKLTPDEDRHRSQMLKSSFELLRRSQAVMWNPRTPTAAGPRKRPLPATGTATAPTTTTTTSAEEDPDDSPAAQTPTQTPTPTPTPAPPSPSPSPAPSTPEEDPVEEEEDDPAVPVVLLPYMQAVFDEVVRAHEDGVFVTCYWKYPLRLLGRALKQRRPDLAMQSIDGESTASHRGAVVGAVASGDTRIVLMTTACALSVTFTNLKTVLVIGACLNASQQEQAIARVVGRIGQTARTCVKYFNAVVKSAASASGAGAGAAVAAASASGSSAASASDAGWVKTVQHAIQACHSGRRSYKEELLGDEKDILGLSASGAAGNANATECTSLLSSVLAVLGALKE